MGFRENLKAQLQYAGMRVKDLSARTGIKKPTLDSYLRSNGYSPSVEAGVKIARALGVTAEYLARGADEDPPEYGAPAGATVRLLFSIAAGLSERDQLRLLEIAKIFKKTAV